MKEKNEIYDKKGYIQNELQNNHIKGNGSFILKRFLTMKINLKKRVQFAVKKKNQIIKIVLITYQIYMTKIKNI